MKFTELKNSIQGGAASIYLFEGDDAYFRMKGEESVKSAFLEMPELNYSAFDGETLKGQAYTSLVTAIKNYPFMAEKRIVKVSEFYPSESDFDTYFKELFEDFPPTSILIIVNSGAKKGVDLKRKKTVTYVDCNKPDQEAVTKWIYLTLRRAGISAPASVCESIGLYCLCNMARVSVEVQKLIDYKGNGELTQDDVDALVYKDAEYRLYELTNTVPRRDFTKFANILDELLKKGGDEIYILNGLFNYFKNLLTVSSSQNSDAELAVQLKMKEYGVKKSREQAYSIGEEKLKYYVKYIYGCISDVKCGRATPENALQKAQNAIFFGNISNI